MRLSARADRGIIEQTNGSGALSRCMSEEIRQYNKFCACLITPPVRASGSISISTPSGPFALPTLKVDRMDTIASHIYVSKVILTIQLTGHNMRQRTSVSAKARPGQILNHVNVLYESRRERYIPASETKGIVHCIIVQGAVSFYKSFWQERVCILMDFHQQNSRKRSGRTDSFSAALALEQTALSALALRATALTTLALAHPAWQLSHHKLCT